MLTTLVERAPLFADLRRRGLAEDLIQDTLMTVTGRIGAGHVIDDPHAYAARCVTNLAKRTYLRATRETATSDAALEFLAPSVDDVADRVLQRMAMRDVLDMIRSVNAVIAALDPLALELVRAELARTDQKQLAARLGMSRPTLYRRKGPAITAFVRAVAQRAGTSPCAMHVGALLAAAGDSGFDGARAAAAHAEDCEQCSETIRHLAVAKHGLALIAPIPLIATTGDPGTALDRAQCLLHGAADWLRLVLLRTGDPMPLGGSAGKTAAIVAAACTGGGGLYCAVEGVPVPLAGRLSQEAAARPATAAPAPAKVRATAATIRPTAGFITQVGTTVRVLERRDVKATQIARKRQRERAAAAATASARAQAIREFALRSRIRESAAKEFNPAATATPGTIALREFARPEPGPEVNNDPNLGSASSDATLTKREFGAP